MHERTLHSTLLISSIYLSIPPVLEFIGKYFNDTGVQTENRFVNPYFIFIFSSHFECGVISKLFGY
jgi:hypothetical protein